MKKNKKISASNTFINELFETNFSTLFEVTPGTTPQPSGGAQQTLAPQAAQSKPAPNPNQHLTPPPQNTQQAAPQPNPTQPEQPKPTTPQPDPNAPKPQEGLFTRIGNWAKNMWNGTGTAGKDNIIYKTRNFFFGTPKDQQPAAQPTAAAAQPQPPQINTD